MQRTYIAIDLKSYYASVECMERSLDPMTTNLVVADLSRTEKTICLAVSPSLKAYGIPGRARLFEVVERVKEVNAERRRKAGGNLFEKSCDAHELATDPSRAVGYLVAPPQMAKYIQISTQIYNVYLKYIAPEDIHVYSIDEVMMDVTSYADQGITGTSVEKRDDFLRMMEDSRSGRIDRILVKSTSRFARNIKESLEAVRELKSLGVSVYFEEQNIDTAQATGEALTAVFSALAQKESESISERMRHSYQMRMQRGVFSTRCAPYGYRLVDNQLEVIEDEAVVIRQIFDRYLSGISMDDIAKEITARGIPTKQNTPFWQLRSIQYILRNEKYIGNSLVQKTYATVTLPHRKKENKGEEDQYLIEETHPPIVSQEVFDKVQRLLSRKSAFIPPRASTPHPFSCKIVCGHCGAICKRKVCRGTAYWVCQTHEKSAESCLTMQTPESEITEAFLRVYFRLKRYGEEILTQLIQALQTAKTGRLLWSEDIISLNKRIADIASQERLLAQLKQQAIVDPDIFISRSNQLAEQRREAKLKKSHILRAEDDQTIQRTQELLDILEEGPDLLMTFDGALFSELVEKITIQNNSTAIFRLINGLEIPEHFERRK